MQDIRGIHSLINTSDDNNSTDQNSFYPHTSKELALKFYSSLGLLDTTPEEYHSS